MAYRVELASTKRAGCRNTECKKESIKIDKGELRLGSWVDYGEHQGWAWKHWGCVTPVQLASLQDALEGDMDMLDGYEELPGDCQEKVKRAIENGHVDDEDWRGDVEQNRPGKKGFRSPAAKKKKVEDEEAAEHNNGDESPSKPAPKKRGRANKDDLEDDDVMEPAHKKTKATAKKGRKTKTDEDSHEVAVEEPAEVTSQTPTGKAKPVKGRGKDVVPEKVGKGKTEPAANKSKGDERDAAADEVDATVAPSKKTKAAGKKGKKTGNEDVADTSVVESQPKKATGQPRKAKVAGVTEQGPTSDPNEQLTKAAKKPRATKNTANTKKPIIKKAKNNAVDDAAEATEASKAKKGRKKAANSNAKD